MGAKINVCSKGDIKVVATIELERHMAYACVFGIIISKRGYREEPGSIVLFESDKSLEVSFYGTILLFILAISFQMEDGGKMTLAAEKIAKQ